MDVSGKGRVGRIEKKDTRGGPMIRFSLAESKNTKDAATGNWQEKTTWWNCTLFGKRPGQEGGYDMASGFLDQVEVGDMLYVTGSVEMNEWQGSDGTIKKEPQLIVRTFFPGRRKQQRVSQPATAAQTNVDSFGEVTSDDDWLK